MLNPTLVSRPVVIAASLASALVAAPIAADPLPAFPGAEGAGMYAAGGRGGDAYYVTNLNDSGAGSLRHGIDTANGPRTIVFDVGGTIHLQSDLRIDKPYLTIAGQTAPGGGITLADRATRVSDTHDVILQHLRFRPGDTFTAPGVYEPDSLWVSGSSNVIIDHVSASWSTDEVLSTTHGSHNVTVQWSMITEALHNADHAKGNHGYGSLINGGDFSFHHNLYAHNRSRNPRPGSDGTRLDFVSNVIYNAGDRYGYNGGEAMDMNFVGNIGIDGPNTRAGSLFHSGGSDTTIHSDDNYLDRNEHAPFQLTPAGHRAISGSHSLSSSRIDLPAVTTTSARQTYINVLSRAGASAIRDAVDHRVIRSVLDKDGHHIDRPHQVGGWPTVPNGVPDTGTARDGIPDWWKQAHGLAIEPPVGDVDSGDGYTWLEKYLHSLSPHSMPPAATEPLVFSTAFGHGADAHVIEASGQSDGSGDADALATQWTGAAAQQNQYVLLRFDLAALEPGSVADAALELTAYADLPDQELRLYGVDPAATDTAWGELTVDFDDAPGLDFDGDATTRGLLHHHVLSLGSLQLDDVLEGDAVRFENPNLAVFLNLLLAEAEDPDAATATLLLETSTFGAAVFASKEATSLGSGTTGDFPAGTFAPRLLLEALSLATSLLGDADADGDVDAFDLGVWQTQFGMTGPALAADFDADGDVDAFDLGLWQLNFGVGVGVNVPEPVTLTWLAWTGAALVRCGRRR